LGADTTAASIIFIIIIIKDIYIEHFHYAPNALNDE